MKTLSKRLVFVFFIAFILTSTNSFGQEESQKIYEVIEKKRAFNENNKNSIVYKIQLYNGIEADAAEMKVDFESKYEQYKVKLTYDPPEWKTQIVGFKTRLDADRALLVIREDYENAIVLEEKI